MSHLSQGSAMTLTYGCQHNLASVMQSRLFQHRGVNSHTKCRQWTQRCEELKSTDHLKQKPVRQLFKKNNKRLSTNRLFLTMGWMTENLHRHHGRANHWVRFPTEERPHTIPKCICNVFIVSENYWVQTFLDGEEGQ